MSQLGSEGQIQKLVSKSIRSSNNGDIRLAVSLLDEAIQIAESKGVPDFGLRIHREIIASGKPPDLSRAIPVYEWAISYFARQGNRLQQIHYMIQRATTTWGALGNTELALEYLDETQAMISSCTEEELTQTSAFFPSHDPETIKNVLISYMMQVERLRKQFGSANRSR